MLPVLAVPVEIAAQVQADPQSLYEAAVADRLAGQHAQAIDRLERVLAQRPNDVDARLNLGLSLLALDRLTEAETAFQTVLRQSPSYTDALIGLARIAERRGDRAAARGYAAQAATLSPEREDIAAYRRGLDDVVWRIDIDASRSRLSAGLPDWTGTRFSTSRILGRGWAISGAIERTERFERTDVYFEGRIDRRLANGDVYLALGGTHDADYRPEVAVMAGGSTQFAPGLRGTLDASVARYVSGTVEALHPGLTAGLFGERLQVAARWINVWDELGQHRSGYGTSATWSVTDRFRLSAGHSDAPESSEGTVTDVVATNFGAAFDLTDRLTLRLVVVDEDRGSYGREELALGVAWRF